MLQGRRENEKESKRGTQGIVYGKLNDWAKELRPEAVDFCRRLIRTPASSGNEKEVADLYLAEMKKVGYDEIFRDDWGNVVGIINGVEPGPTLMYNSHLDQVDPGARLPGMDTSPMAARSTSSKQITRTGRARKGSR